MTVLSRQQMRRVAGTYREKYGLDAFFVDLRGRFLGPAVPPDCLREAPQRRLLALQDSVLRGEPSLFMPTPGLTSWLIALEHRRVIRGGLLSAPVALAAPPSGRAGRAAGVPARTSPRAAGARPAWPPERIQAAAFFLQNVFYDVTGWTPEIMRENWLKTRQHEQLNQAMAEQRQGGAAMTHPFDKERALLASSRAGDLPAARRILNEMLAAMFLTSTDVPVLKARAMELLTTITRAAVEDNPLLEPLVQSSRAWTERLASAPNFEELSGTLMAALDEFVELIHFHGLNRTNPKVRQTIDYVWQNYMNRISLDSAAQAVGLSPCRLAHVVKDLTGKTVVQIIHEVRVAHARRLLMRSDMKCTEIAYEVGFCDQSYFIKHFKSLMGLTPARYRRVSRTERGR